MTLKVVVFDERLYHAHGEVYDWCHKITTAFTAFAVHYAPVRSGRLVAGIHGHVRQIGPRQVQGTIESTAPHTFYVLRGTKGPIMTDQAFANPGGATKVVHGPDGFERTVRVPGYWMPIPAWGGYRKRYAVSVSGQRPNNFLLKAWRATARNHKAIRGVEPDFIRNP